MKMLPGQTDGPLHAVPEHGRGRLPEPSPLRGLGGLVRRNRLLLFACLVFVLGGAAFANRTVTPVYRASVSLRIDEKQGILPTLDPLSIAAENEINTEVEMLRSRLLAEAAVDSLALRIRLLQPRIQRSDVFSVVAVAPDLAPGEYRLAASPAGGFALENRMTGAPLGTAPPGQPLTAPGLTVELRPAAAALLPIDFTIEPKREVVERLLESLEVTRRTREAYMVDITYEDTDPRLAQLVPDALARLFQRDRLESQRTETRSTVAFLREQIAKIEGQLANAEDRLRAFRESQGVVSLVDQASTEVQRLVELKAQRNALEAERSALAHIVAEAHERAAGSPDGEGSSAYRDLVAFPSLLRNQAASGLLTSLAEAEARLTELLGRRSMNDPEVQVLQDRVRQLENQLRTLTETYLASITHEVRAMDASLGDAAVELSAIPAKEVEFKRLERESTLLAELYTLLQARLKEAEIAQAAADPSVRIVDAALLPIEPIRPRPLLNLTLALAVGLLLGLTASYVRERTDTAVHTRRDLQAVTGLPVIGGVPRTGIPRLRRGRRRLEAAAAGRDLAIDAPRALRPMKPRMPLVTEILGTGSPLTEAYSRVATNLSFLGNGSELRTLLVTSALEGEGKTTSAINLALTLARQGGRVLFIDGDLRRGTASRLGRAGHPGFADMLAGHATFERAVQRISVGDDVLDFIGAGRLPEQPSRLLAARTARDLLAGLAADHDFTIIDSPPINMVADAALLASLADGVVVVARAGRTPPEALSFAIEQLRSAEANVLGVVLNNIDTRDATYDPSYRYYRSAYGA